MLSSLRDWAKDLLDDYAYLRSQYEAIIEHTEYLMKNSPDKRVVETAHQSKRRAQHDLERLKQASPHAQTV